MPEIAGVAVAWVFLAGIVSFLSPCVLPLVPGYVSYVTGRAVGAPGTVEADRSRLAALALSVAFVLGFSLVFMALGASASAVGQLFQSFRREADLIAGLVIIVFGLHLTGLLRLSLLNREWRFTGAGGGGSGVGAFVLGGAFAFGWTPCIGPILGTILTLGATRTAVGEGVALLGIYALGLAIPFLLVAAFADFFVQRLKRVRRLGRYLQIGSGVVLIAVGIATATGDLTSFGTWLLVTFPWFQYVVI